jgi:exosortase family protein XrtM
MARAQSLRLVHARSLPAPPVRPVLFLSGFAGLYTAFFLLYGLAPNDMLRDVVFHHGLTVPGAFLVELLAPDTPAQAVANTIVSPYARLEIVRGCEGAGTMFLLAAATLAFPAPWRRRLAGLALGLAVVHALNLARIVALYFVVAYREPWFLVAHTYVAPLTVLAAVSAFFGWWVLRGDAPPRAARIAA